ncbi:conjugal transfer protein TraL [Vibrio tubiashii]|uniref:conjugal transfer protein TraL n=1 Tax=Vibrio tubiashii TaxID=29498 RepID=UPI000AB28C07|nr:conjugal transfer protein TraL [Vibrio tubiashii]
MKHLTIALAMLTLSLAMPTKSYAIDNAACSIWLCLPTGFGQGCGDAKSAFKKRIKKGQSPLPDLGSCMVTNNLVNSSNDSAKPSILTSKDGIGAYIPEYKICTQWEYVRQGKESEKVCVKKEVIQTHVKHDTPCRYYRVDKHQRERRPFNCLMTVRYVQTFMDGSQYGDTYYFDSSGNKVHVPR